MDNSSNESIGKRIANLRKNRNLTQNQLADLIGNTPNPDKPEKYLLNLNVML